MKTQPLPHRLPTRAARLFPLALAALTPVSMLTAGGSGTDADPYTGSDVAAVMDSGNLPAYCHYLIATDRDFGSVDVVVGETTSRNLLTVNGGASVSIGNNLILGHQNGTAVNTLNVGGDSAGSVAVANTVYAGYAGQVNFINVKTGGILSCTDMEIGYGTYAYNNFVYVQEGGILNATGTIDVGGFGPANFLMIQTGGTVTCDRLLVGDNTPDDSVVLVRGEGTTLDCAKDMTVANWGSRCALYVTDGAKVTTGYVISGTRHIAGGVGAGEPGNPDLGDHNKIVVSGSGASINYGGVFFAGASGDANYVLIDGGGTIKATDGAIGFRSDAEHNMIDVIGPGSLLHFTGALAVGYAGNDNFLYCAEGALVRADEGIAVDYTTGTGSAILLAGGFLAVGGDARDAINALIAGGKILVYSATANDGAGAYIPATATNTTLALVEDDAAGKTITSTTRSAGSDVDFDGYDELGGKTLLSGGDTFTIDTEWANVWWPDVDERNLGWFESSWYGWFYTDNRFSPWIWQENHGWQYIWQSGNDLAVFAYDSAMGDWLYTSSSSYPWFYNYASQKWIYYVSGKAPSRTFGYYDAENNWGLHNESVTMIR
ncbi:MAG TPA: hypothetical protein PKI32_02425 [Opitutales bacterium]|nr:hypothetical protein [Opitutales bacterium]